MDERLKKAFELATEVHKQLITLATAIVAITVSFSKDIFAGQQGATDLLQWGWVLYLLSIMAGVWALLAITGTLARAAEANQAPVLYKSNIQFPAILQITLFLAGTGLLIAFGWSFRSP
jgi:hypothetical protein